MDDPLARRNFATVPLREGVQLYCTSAVDQQFSSSHHGPVIAFFSSFVHLPNIFRTFLFLRVITARHKKSSFACFFSIFTARASLAASFAS